MSKPELRTKPDDTALATWWRGENEGTFHWRCQIPARHLPGQVLKAGLNDLTEPSPGRFEFPWQRGTAIWQFPGSMTAMLLMLQMQENGTRVLVEVDDDYLTMYPGAPRDWHWRETIVAGGEDYNTVEGHRKICAAADGVIVSTPYLADRYRPVNRNVFVCPNSIDPADWPEPKKPDDGVFRIGWAGSASHVHDAPPVRRALSWASRQPDVEIVLIGDVPSTGCKARRVPWTNTLADYRESLAQLDVGVCPLTETQWAKGKSDIKALEYAMAGALPVVSRTEAYKPWFDRLSAATPKDFEQIIRWCVRNPAEVRSLAAEAREYVLAERTIGESVHLWREATQTP